MDALKVLIKPLTPFYTHLQSDTIFGEFCWHYRFLYGNEKLEKLLEGFEENPFIVFSDGFPENYLPFPTIPFTRFPVKSGGVEQYKLFKKFKKKTLIKKEIFLELAKSEETLSAEKLFTIFENSVTRQKDADRNINGKVQKQMHVTIDRRSGTHLEGHLFDMEYRFYSPETTIEIYAKFNPEKISEKEIEQTFKFMGLNGFGGEKTTGKGKFKLQSLDDFDLPEPVNASGFVSLSTGMVKKDEVTDYSARFFTKFPKHGPEAIIEGINIFKNPVILTRAGSTFKYASKQEIYGRIYRLSSNNNHIHCAKIIPLFVRLQ